MQMSIFFAEEPHANHSALQDSEKDWQTRVATSCLPLVPLLQSIAPAGWYGRTSPASCRVTEGGILEPSWTCLNRLGMFAMLKYLMHNSLVSHNAEEGFLYVLNTATIY